MDQEPDIALRHLSPDELLDYQAGDLNEEDRERVQEHLSLCPVCVQALLDLESFPALEPPREEDRLSDADVAGEWRRFRAAAAVTPRRREVPPFRSRRPERIAYALAATLLVAVVGLSLWGIRLRGEIGELSAPRTGVHVADLTPVAAARERSAADEEVVRVPAWADRVLLILNLAPGPSFPEYRLEIATPEGRTVWSRAGVHPGPDGNFVLDAPRRFLTDGSYHVLLYGLKRNDLTRVAEYKVRIQREE